jgi:hypothetical protein
MFNLSKKTDSYKVMSDGFVFLLVTDVAYKMFDCGIFSLYELHDDDSESLIETRTHLEQAIDGGNDIGIEVGNVFKGRTLIVSYTKDLEDGNKEDTYYAIRPDEDLPEESAKTIFNNAVAQGCHSASISIVIESTDY